jgi:hypothetical protein
MIDWPTVQGFLVSACATILGICLPIVARALVGWIDAHRKEIESRIADSLKLDPWQLDEFAKRAVLAAEQIMGSKAGQEKKAWALGLIDAWLKRQGVNVPVAEIEAAVEAAVYSELNANKPAAEAPRQ